MINSNCKLISQQFFEGFHFYLMSWFRTSLLRLSLITEEYGKKGEEIVFWPLKT
jgi:hypothetical protein